jgi:hypothetical protein
VRLFDEPPKNEMVTEMDPVEIADGHEGALQAFGDVLAAADHFHHKSCSPPWGRYHSINRVNFKQIVGCRAPPPVT